MKRCSKCGEEKPATLEYFHRRNLSRDGLCHKCKVCVRAYQVANRERIAERRRTYRAESPKYKEYMRAWRAENRAHVAEYEHAYWAMNKERKAEYRSANKEHIDKRARAYYIVNKARYRARESAYRTANPERGRYKSNLYRARKCNAEGTHTVDDIKAQYKRQKGKCFWCGVKVGKIFHVDHVVPLSRGGSNDVSNLVVACPTCNLSKHNRMPHEWPQGNRLI